MTTNTTSKAIWKSGINALMIEFNTTCKPEMKLINKIINQNVLFNWNLSEFPEDIYDPCGPLFLGIFWWGPNQSKEKGPTFGWYQVCTDFCTQFKKFDHSFSKIITYFPNLGLWNKRCVRTLINTRKKLFPLCTANAQWTAVQSRHNRILKLLILWLNVLAAIKIKEDLTTEKNSLSHN